MTNNDILFTPWKINNLEIKNRIVLCPMGGTSIFGWMEPNHFDKEASELLLTIAKNNCGLIIPGIAPIRDAVLGKWLYQGKAKFKKLKSFMEEVHKTGAKLFVQMTAGFGRSFAITDQLKILATNKIIGTIAKPILNMDRIMAAPSDLPNRWSEDVRSRALTKEEIQKFIDAFAKTSKLLKDAGVDGVEVHAVHEGYLLDQFTLPYTNLRTDEYGGSLENRYRFPCEIVKAIKKVCGKDFPVSLRFSVVSKTKDFCVGALPEEKDYKEVGRTFKEATEAVKLLEDAGYDMLNCDNGTYDAWYWAHPPGYMPLNCNLDIVSEFKKYTKLPVVCAGRMEVDAARSAIKEGKIDAMGVARQFLTDPSWVSKLLEGREEEIKPCICCHNACFNFAKYKGSANVQDMDDTFHNARCALNPRTMHGHKYDIKKAKKSKNIAIIGAGIAGLESAIVLTLRGHKVKIYEKDNRIGGVFNEASNFDFKEKDQQLLRWYEVMVKKYNIEIEFNHYVKDLSEIKADEILVCVGSQERTLKVKGSEYAIDAISYLKHKDLPKEGRVVVIGGGLTGCEIAYDLIKHNKEASIVEMQDDLMKVKGLCLANSSYLKDYFTLHKTNIYLNSKVIEITPSSVVVEDKDGNRTTIETDKVIYSIGYTPNDQFKNSKKVHFIGDCYSVGNLRTVIWRAHDICLKI